MQNAMTNNSRYFYIQSTFLLFKMIFLLDNHHVFKYYILEVFVQIAIASYAPYVQIVLRNKGYSYGLTGVIIALGQVAAIVGPLLISTQTDRRGKTKPYLIIAAGVSIISAVPFYLCGNTALVIVSVFILDAFFWSFNPLCDGFINRKLGKERYKYGIIRAAGTFSYMAALVFFAVTGFPDESNNTSILTSFLIFISLMMVSFLIQSDDGREKKKGERKSFSFSWFNRNFYIFMLIVFFTRIGQSVVEKLLASYMTESLHLGGYFSLFIAIGALFEFVSMIIFGRLLEKKKVTPLFMLLLSSIALFIRLLMYLIPNIYVFALAQTLHGLTFGACHVAATTYTSENVSSEHYEVGMAIYWAVATNFAEMLGSLCGGFVIEKCGYPILFASYSLFPFVATVLLLVFFRRLGSSQDVKNK